MVTDETAIEHCCRCIAEEEKLGNQALTREAGERHFQLAMLYRAQVAVLERQRRASSQTATGLVGEAASEGASAEIRHIGL